MNSILNYFLPIYFIFFFGFTFVWRSYATWILGDVLMQIQVRLEEAHLREFHSDLYNAYARRMRRWL